MLVALTFIRTAFARRGYSNLVLSRRLIVLKKVAGRTCLGLLAPAVIGWIIAACDKPAATDQQAPSAGGTEAADTGVAGDGLAHVGSAIDWNTVTPVLDGKEIVAYKRLARYADVWYGGQNAIIQITISADGIARDKGGNEVKLSLGEWKGIIQRVREAPNGIVLATASLQNDDSFGQVDRNVYQLEVVSNNTLRLYWKRRQSP
jgi:hypothetical protein